MYGELSALNATGSFENQCSLASQMDHFPDEASSSGTRVTSEPNPKGWYDGSISESEFQLTLMT